MNQYFFNVTKEERENILDKHKTVYDGYVTQYAQGNMTPLTVQDLANDKQGITVNSRGEVSGYKNVGINESINEMRFDGKSTGLFEDEEESNYMSVGAPLDMIADRQDDVDHGTVDFNKEIEFFDLGDVISFSDDDFKGSFDIFVNDDDSDDTIELTLDSDFDNEKIIPLQENLDKTRDMFLRFKKYN